MSRADGITTEVFQKHAFGETLSAAEQAAARAGIGSVSNVRAHLMGIAARNFRRANTMANPPTITRGGNASSLVGSFVNGATRYQSQDSARFSLSCSEFTTITEGGIQTIDAAHITNSAGVKSRGLLPWCTAFVCDEPAIDFCFLERSGGGMSIFVDGEIAYREPKSQIVNSGNFRYYRMDFGNDTVTYGKAAYSIGIAAGGSGYVVGDRITMDNGTGGATGTPTVFVVSQVSGGAVANGGLVIETAGSYSAVPTGTWAQSSTTGAGTGLQVTPEFFNPQHTTKKPRRYEVYHSGPQAFMGIVTLAAAVVYALAPQPWIPTATIVGDSISAGTNNGYPPSQPSFQIADYLGMRRTTIINAIGGTGWNAGASSWSHPNRVADYIRYNTDIYIFLGSQNDVAGAATTAAVTSTLNQILAANPRALIVGASNIMGGSTSLDASIEAGYLAASDQSRVKYFSTQAPVRRLDPNFYIPVQTPTNDPSHLSDYGQAGHAFTTAWDICNALLSIAR